MKIFVSNLQKEINKENLEKVFIKFGKVTSVSIIRDRFNIDSSGFAFVEMPNKNEAQFAIDGLNGKSLNGNKLTVHLARIRSDDRRQLDRGGGRRQTDIMPEF